MIPSSIIISGFLFAQAPSPQSPEQPPQLICAAVDQAPTLDGSADDAAWASATPITVTLTRPIEPNKGATTKATLRCVRTDREIYFLVEWDDPTQDVSHKSWVWNAQKNAYEEGPDREDMFALAFEHTGEFNPDMLAGVESVWDVWHWKAFRTNPQGYAMDKTHGYMRSTPPTESKAKEHIARDGSPVWIARPEDAGDTVETKQPAPTSHQGDRVPQYIPGKPTGSAADVKAKGAWRKVEGSAGGRWTLELSRKLDTGNAGDDTAFEVGETYKMAVSAFDRTGDMDKASSLIELVLANRAK